MPQMFSVGYKYIIIEKQHAGIKLYFCTNEDNPNIPVMVCSVRKLDK